jgi:Domain of unknown function (DUF4190)
MKPCPYCSAPLEDTAFKCDKCERWLDPKLDATLNADSPPIVLPPRTTSGLAIGSLACAIFGVGPGSIVAVILGYIALRQIRREPLRIGGKGLATAGIVLGWLGIVAAISLLLVGIYFWKEFKHLPELQTTKLLLLSTSPTSSNLSI